MSFGFSPSDIVTLIALTKKAYDGWHSAPSEYADVVQTLKSFRILLEHLDRRFGGDVLDDAVATRQEELGSILEGCKKPLSDLRHISQRYRKLNAFNRVRLGLRDTNGPKDQFTRHINILTPFLVSIEFESVGRNLENNLTSLQGIPNAILNSLPAALGSMIDQRVEDSRSARSSVLTTYGDDDKRAYKELRWQLRSLGIQDSQIRNYRSKLVSFVGGLVNEPGLYAQKPVIGGSRNQRLGRSAELTSASQPKHYAAEQGPSSYPSKAVGPCKPAVSACQPPEPDNDSDREGEYVWSAGRPCKGPKSHLWLQSQAMARARLPRRGDNGGSGPSPTLDDSDRAQRASASDSCSEDCDDSSESQADTDPNQRKDKVAGSWPDKLGAEEPGDCRAVEAPQVESLTSNSVNAKAEAQAHSPNPAASNSVSENPSMLHPTPQRRPYQAYVESVGSDDEDDELVSSRGEDNWAFSRGFGFPSESHSKQLKTDHIHPEKPDRYQTTDYGFPKFKGYAQEHCTPEHYSESNESVSSLQSVSDTGAVNGHNSNRDTDDDLQRSLSNLSNSTTDDEMHSRRPPPAPSGLHFQHLTKYSSDDSMRAWRGVEQHTNPGPSSPEPPQVERVGQIPVIWTMNPFDPRLTPADLRGMYRDPENNAPFSYQRPPQPAPYAHVPNADFRPVETPWPALHPTLFPPPYLPPPPANTSWLPVPPTHAGTATVNTESYNRSAAPFEILDPYSNASGRSRQQQDPAAAKNAARILRSQRKAPTQGSAWSTLANVG